jgi:hypothetical protein
MILSYLMLQLNISLVPCIRVTFIDNNLDQMYVSNINWVEMFCNFKTRTCHIIRKCTVLIIPTVSKTRWYFIFQSILKSYNLQERLSVNLLPEVC